MVNKKAHGESGVVDKEAIEIERARLKQITKNYEKKNIFNFDETAIFWNIMPGCRIVPVDYNLEGLKQEKS